MNYRELSLLFEKMVKNECTEEEANLVMNLLSDRAYDNLFRQLAEEQLKQTETDNSQHEVPLNVLNHQLETILNTCTVPKNVGKVKMWKPGVWYAAASILFFLVIGIFLFKNSTPKSFIVHNKRQQISFGSNKAFLTLSNGKKINLEDAANGAIAAQSNFTIKKTSTGVIVYQANAAAETTGRAVGEPLFNTITTPDGGQYQVVLPDGSKVWLNAASSIKFPAQFAPDERLVELNGEAYFEVVKVSRPAKNHTEPQRLPFIVLSKRQRIEVLGTRFNVNDYAEENCVKTTLLKGSVRISSLIGNNQKNVSPSAILKPGQQSELYNYKLNVGTADTASATAWKDGFFQFDNEDIYVVMRKIARWYNVEVNYEGDMRGKVFSGVISKYTDVTEVLKMLQLTESVSFTIKGRKITVS
jgi:ferric-dicitrate binding protein FerR (iron transport regulator)